MINTDADLSGPYRKIECEGGWRVVGQGASLSQTVSEQEADDILRGLRLNCAAHAAWDSDHFITHCEACGEAGIVIWSRRYAETDSNKYYAYMAGAGKCFIEDLGYRLARLGALPQELAIRLGEYHAAYDAGGEIIRERCFRSVTPKD